MEDIMRIKRRSKLLLFLWLVSTVSLNYCMDGGMGQQEPLIRMNYRLAFDQRKIHEKFHNLMERWNCAENTSLVPHDAICVDIPNEYQQIPQLEEQADESAHRTEEEAYRTACLKKLQGARRWAITEDAREALITLGLLGTAATTLSLVLPPDSMGGSFGIFAAVFNAAALLRPMIRSGCNLAIPPANPLEHLENTFALNQCFIPNKLWPIIKEKFMLARTNQFQQRTCMDFLEFALGLTLFKPKSTLSISENLEQGIHELFEKIDHFFLQYHEPNREDLWKCKQNIEKFIRLLTNPDSADTPRYIYLHGPGGIGKTHFVNKLTEWIDELIPNSLKTEHVQISSAEELEGSLQRPGAMLTVLRNQLMENKHGSIVFMDEAKWLNHPQIVDTAKRVFNGDQSKLSTSYFGNGVDGSGIKLNIPPMLIFVASNAEIEDTALKTRFDTINFPAPKKERLIEYAKEIAHQSKLIQRTHINLETFNFTQWLEHSQANNFRDIASQIVPAIISAHESRTITEVVA
jgi:hypothetical protein